MQVLRLQEVAVRLDTPATVRLPPPSSNFFTVQPSSSMRSLRHEYPDLMQRLSSSTHLVGRGSWEIISPSQRGLEVGGNVGPTCVSLAHSMTASAQNSEEHEAGDPLSSLKYGSTYHPNVWKDEFIESLEGGEGVDEAKIKELIEEVRNVLTSMGDGAISASAYDTAWVARVPALDGSATPQFPLSLQWIVDNQLEDGSWGEKQLFLAYERVFNSLACVLALTTWKTEELENSISRGLAFITKYAKQMEDEPVAHMPIGFELCFISMLDEAKQMGLTLPYDLPFIKTIQEAREKKLRSIPIDYFHIHPSTILHSLEGLKSLVDWDKILTLQSPDGSFLGSPASTACVLMHTGDKKCLDFLNSLLTTFNNAVPCTYPLDLFERLWAIDGLMRLGISRFFQKEIKEALDYVYKYWTDTGIAWARATPVHDIDDTSMGFRILRLHGYGVSADCMEHFTSAGRFFCMVGESRHGVTEMLSLYRASQLRFPGETILEEAHAYSKGYLEKALQNKDIFDKWTFKKDLIGEVEYALKFPWHRSPPRLETRNYLHQYGADDLWLGKTIYRFYNVNNRSFLKLGKADFNRCQAIHQQELLQIQRWWNQSGFLQLHFTRQRPTEAYFGVAACIFEPEFSTLRLSYIKSACLTFIIDDLFDKHGSLSDLRFFIEAVKRWDPSAKQDMSEEIKICYNGIYDTVTSIVEDVLKVQGPDISQCLRKFWEDFLSAHMVEAEWSRNKCIPRFDEYLENAKVTSGFHMIIVHSIFFCGELLPDDILQHLDVGSRFMNLVCLSGRLINDTKTFKAEREWGELASSISCYMKDNPRASEEEAKAYVYEIVDHSLKELNFELIQNNAMPVSCKRLLFETARMAQFFYMVRDGLGISEKEMKEDVQNILFEQVSV